MCSLYCILYNSSHFNYNHPLSQYAINSLWVRKLSLSNMFEPRIVLGLFVFVLLNFYNSATPDVRDYSGWVSDRLLKWMDVLRSSTCACVCGWRVIELNLNMYLELLPLKLITYYVLKCDWSIWKTVTYPIIYTIWIAKRDIFMLGIVILWWNR